MDKSTKSQCQKCNKEFLIIPQEQAFYKQKNLPPPTHCPECRRNRRRGLRNERKLYRRDCDKCKKELLSSYSKDSPYIVYCEHCYLNTVN